MLNFIVIGAGLMGSSAAKYLAKSGQSGTIIGTAEPQNWQNHQGVFASHYDEGRITHRLSKDTIWTTLADHSMRQYRAIEQESGITFYQPRGCLSVLKPTSWAGKRPQVSQYGQPWSGTELLAFPSRYESIYEPDPAGFISPRRLITAQLTIAKAHGCERIAEQVVSVIETADLVRVTTESGTVLEAERVLVCAGAYTDVSGLLSTTLGLRVKSETILYAEVSAKEADRWSAMPAVIYEIESPVLDGIYLLPPLLYPDGTYYVKMGCDTAADRTLETAEAMNEWMVHGDSDTYKSELQQAMLAIMPTLQASGFYTHRCLVTYSPSGKPIIDQVTARRFVATAGNGSSAKCADTLGWLAAQLVQGASFPKGLERQIFARELDR